MNLLWLIPLFVAHGAQGVREPALPPGTVTVPGGKTAIGIDLADVERMLAADANSQNYAGSLSAETPRHEVDVGTFHLMVTEVTNEQYAAFVRASGARPPEPWGDAAIRAGAKAFFEEREREKNRALAQGRPVPEPETFDRQAWWVNNWRGAAWEVPAGDRRRPVVFVDHDDARSYARWAGLRLPTELEYQRAVRGDTQRTYPWGNDWDSEKYAATSLLKKKGSALPVASFPAGVNRQGVFDLAGNVWEWTSSAYAPFPGYEPKVYEFGYGAKARSVNAITEWNSEQRVVVGGSFQNANLMARATTRRPADRTQSTDALGFRCAASARAGIDQAAAILEEDLDPNLRPRENGSMVVYAPEQAIAFERWTIADGDPEHPTPPGYAVITDYRYALWAPVAMVRATDITTFERQSVNAGPIALGFLSSNLALGEPDLPAATYLVSYRARGTPRFPAEAREGPPIEEVLELDVAFDHLIFTDFAGRAVRAIRAHVDYGNLRDGRVTREPDGALRFEACVPSRTTLKGFLFTLPIVTSE